METTATAFLDGATLAPAQPAQPAQPAANTAANNAGAAQAAPAQAGGWSDAKGALPWSRYQFTAARVGQDLIVMGGYSGQPPARPFSIQVMLACLRKRCSNGFGLVGLCRE